MKFEFVIEVLVYELEDIRTAIYSDSHKIEYENRKKELEQAISTLKRVGEKNETMEQFKEEIHDLKNKIEILETDNDDINFKNCIELNRLLIKENAELKSLLDKRGSE